MKVSLRLFLIALFITGCANLCTKDRKSMSIDDVVRAYLEIAFNMTEISQKSMLLQYATGDLKAAIAAAPDQTIREAYINPRYTLLSVSIIERRDITPRESHLTYNVTYREKSKNGKNSEASKVETENMVSMFKEKGKWYIQSVLDNKTSIEFPLLQMSVIKGKAD